MPDLCVDAVVTGYSVSLFCYMPDLNVDAVDDWVYIVSLFRYKPDL